MKLDNFPLDADAFNKTLGERLRKTKGQNKDRITSEVIAKFCGLTVITINEWLRGRTPAGGLVSLKLAYLMRTAGLTSPELDCIHDERPFSGYLGELLAFEVIDMDTARQFAGNVGPQAVLAAARGANLMKRKNTRKEIKEFKEQNPELQEYLEIAIDELRGKLGISTAELAEETSSADSIDVAEDDVAKEEEAPQADSSQEVVAPVAPAIEPPAIEDSPPAPVVEQPVPVLTTEVHVDLDGDELAKKFSEQLSSLLEPLVAAVQSHVSEVIGDVPRYELVMRVARDIMTATAAANLVMKLFTPQERALLRDLTGEDIFNLSNATHKLCSERAFNEGN